MCNTWIWKANIVEFWIKYFHLICHLNLTTINCITLKIRSKADFNSKSQNIWQQIILFSHTVMQKICTWSKIWTLLGRLSLMSNAQLMKKNKKYIPCVPHKNNCKKKIGSHDMKQTDSSIIIVRNVCVLTSASMIVYLFFTRSWSAIIGPKQPKVVSTTMARTINMHTDLQISSCWEHISTWNMHE
jgi:hypothetical protein